MLSSLKGSENDTEYSHSRFRIDQMHQESQNLRGTSTYREDPKLLCLLRKVPTLGTHAGSLFIHPTQELGTDPLPS